MPCSAQGEKSGLLRTVRAVILSSHLIFPFVHLLISFSASRWSFTDLW